MAGISDFFRGDTKVIRIVIDSTDFLDGTAWLTLKMERELDDVDATLQKTADIVADTDPAKCAAVFSLTPADTEIDPGKYYYDVQLVSADGSVVATILSDKIRVLTDTTRSIS